VSGIPLQKLRGKIPFAKAKGKNPFCKGGRLWTPTIFYV
jgi:hypothetical protein